MTSTAYRNAAALFMAIAAGLGWRVPAGAKTRTQVRLYKK